MTHGVKYGVTVTKDDISVCHRVGKPKNGTRPVIVKFISRRKRREVMVAKKNLRTSHPNVYINDDLTVLRAKLLHYVKAQPDVESAWTIDGRIFAKKKMPPGSTETARPMIFESPDDLFLNLGMEQIDFGKLGLSHLE